jgi:WD40 repeat protein
MSYSHVVLQLRNYRETAMQDYPDTSASSASSSASSASSASAKPPLAVRCSSYTGPSQHGMMLTSDDKSVSLWDMKSVAAMGLPVLVCRRRLAADDHLDRQGDAERLRKEHERQQQLEKEQAQKQNMFNGLYGGNTPNFDAAKKRGVIGQVASSAAMTADDDDAGGQAAAAGAAAAIAAAESSQRLPPMVGPIVGLVCGFCQGQVHVVAMNGREGRGRLRLYRPDLRGKPYAQIPAHRESMLAVSFHRGRSEIVTSGSDGRVNIWAVRCIATVDRSAGKRYGARQRLALSVHQHFRHQIDNGEDISKSMRVCGALAVDEQQDLIIGGVGGDIFLWNVLNGDVVLRCPGLHERPIREISYCAATCVLTTSTMDDSNICMWQLPQYGPNSDRVALSLSVCATASGETITTALSSAPLGGDGGGSAGGGGPGSSLSTTMGGVGGRRSIAVSFDSENCLNVWKVSHRRVRGVCSFLLPVDVNARERNGDRNGRPRRCSICHIQGTRGVDDGHHIIVLAGTRMFVFEVHWSSSAGHMAPTVIHPPTGEPSAMEVLAPPWPEEDRGGATTTRRQVLLDAADQLHSDKGGASEKGNIDYFSIRRRKRNAASSLVVLTSRGLVGICAPAALPPPTHGSGFTRRSIIELPKSRRVLQKHQALRPSSREAIWEQRKSEAKAICVSKSTIASSTAPLAASVPGGSLVAIGWTDGRVDIANLHTGMRERMLLLPSSDTSVAVGSHGKTKGYVPGMAITSVAMISAPSDSPNDDLRYDSGGGAGSRSSSSNVDGESYAVVGGTSDGYLHVWSVGKYSHSLNRTMAVHNAPVRAVLIAGMPALAARAAAVNAAQKGASAEQVAIISDRVFLEMTAATENAGSNQHRHCIVSAAADGEVKVWEVVTGAGGVLLDIVLRGYFTTSEKPLTYACLIDGATISCGFATGSIELWSLPFSEDGYAVAVAKHSILESNAHGDSVCHISVFTPTEKPERRVGVEAETVDSSYEFAASGGHAPVVGAAASSGSTRKVWHVYDMLLLTSAIDGTCLLWGVTSLGMGRSCSGGLGGSISSKKRGLLVVLRRLGFSGPVRSACFFRGTIVARVGALSIRLTWPALPPEQHPQKHQRLLKNASRGGKSFVGLMPPLTYATAKIINMSLPRLVGLDSSMRDAMFHPQLVTSRQENEKNMQRRFMQSNSRAFMRELASDGGAAKSRKRMARSIRPDSRSSSIGGDDLYSVTPWDEDSQLEFSAFDAQGSILDDDFVPPEWAKQLQEPAETSEDVEQKSMLKNDTLSTPTRTPARDGKRGGPSSSSKKSTGTRGRKRKPAVRSAEAKVIALHPHPSNSEKHVGGEQVDEEEVGDQKVNVSKTDDALTAAGVVNEMNLKGEKAMTVMGVGDAHASVISGGSTIIAAAVTTTTMLASGGYAESQYDEDRTILGQRPKSGGPPVGLLESYQRIVGASDPLHGGLASLSETAPNFAQARRKDRSITQRMSHAELQYMSRVEMFRDAEDLVGATAPMARQHDMDHGSSVSAAADTTRTSASNELTPAIVTPPVRATRHEVVDLVELNEKFRSAELMSDGGSGMSKQTNKLSAVSRPKILRRKSKSALEYINKKPQNWKKHVQGRKKLSERTVSRGPSDDGDQDSKKASGTKSHHRSRPGTPKNKVPTVKGVPKVTSPTYPVRPVSPDLDENIARFKYDNRGGAMQSGYPTEGELAENSFGHLFGPFTEDDQIQMNEDIATLRDTGTKLGEYTAKGSQKRATRARIGAPLEHRRAYENERRDRRTGGRKEKRVDILEKERLRFTVDGSHGSGHAVPKGFSDRRLVAAHAAKDREDAAFQRAVERRREDLERKRDKKEKFTRAQARKRRKSKSKSKRERTPLRGLEHTLAARREIWKATMKEAGSATAPIEPSYFRDSTGTKQMLLAVPPPPAPKMSDDDEWWSQHGSSRPGSRHGGHGGFDDDSSYGSREDYNDRLQDTAFGVMENVEEDPEIDGAVGPETGVDDDGLDGASVYSDPGMYSEAMWNECYPATPWGEMSEKLKEAELKVAIWDTDVAAAVLRSEIFGDRVPRPVFQTSIDANERAEWKRFRDWYATNSAVRAALVAREAELSLLFDPVVKASRERGEVEMVDELVAQATEASAIKGGVIKLLNPPPPIEDPAMIELRGMIADSRSSLSKNKWYLKDDDEEESDGLRGQSAAGEGMSAVVGVSAEVASPPTSLLKGPSSAHVNFVEIARSMLQDMELRAHERGLRRARRSYLNWYCEDAGARLMFLEHRNKILKKAVEVLVRWGRSRALLSLEPFGPLAEGLLAADDAAAYIDWDDMDDEEREMEVMSALCDKSVREVATNEGLHLPPVDGIVDGSGIDTPEELAFVHWYSGRQQTEEEEANPEGKSSSLAKRTRLDFLKREAASASQSGAVIDSMLISQYVVADATLTEVAVPKTQDEMNEDMVLNNGAEPSPRSKELSRQKEREFREWATTEKKIVQYDTFVEPISVSTTSSPPEQKVSRSLATKEMSVELKSQPMELSASKVGEISAPSASKVETPAEPLAASKATTDETRVGKDDTTSDPSGIDTPFKTKPSGTTSTRDISLATSPGEPTDQVMEVESRHRRGAPAGQRSSYGNFSGWYQNNRDVRREFLRRRRHLFHRARDQRKNSPIKQIADELPDIFSNTLHLETYEDDEECFKAQAAADEVAWYSDKWVVRAWYSSEALREDDRVMKEMEFKARKEARRALIAARRAANELLLRNGFEHFGLSSASESEEESDVNGQEDSKAVGKVGDDADYDNEGGAGMNAHDADKDAEVIVLTGPRFSPMKKSEWRQHKMKVHELHRKQQEVWEAQKDEWKPSLIEFYEETDLSTQGWSNGSGLFNGDEAYFAKVEAEERERTRLAREKDREKKELERMRIEERDQRAYEWEIKLAKSRADKHDEIFQAVLRVRREAQERANDPDGLTKAQRAAVDAEEARMEEERIAKEKVRLAVKRELEQMEIEDDLGWDFREEEREKVRRRNLHKAMLAEEKQQSRDRKAMLEEDEMSRKISELATRARKEMLRIQNLEKEAFGTRFQAFFDDNGDRVLLSKSLLRRQRRELQKQDKMWAKSRKIIAVPLLRSKSEAGVGRGHLIREERYVAE